MRSASRNRKINSSSSADTTGSRPADGSSKNRSFGSMTIARASAARLTVPPESCSASDLESIEIHHFELGRLMMRMVFLSSLVCSRNGRLTSARPSSRSAARRPGTTRRSDGAPRASRVRRMSDVDAEQLHRCSARFVQSEKMTQKCTFTRTDPPMITRILPAFTLKSTPAGCAGGHTGLQIVHIDQRSGGCVHFMWRGGACAI